MDLNEVRKNLVAFLHMIYSPKSGDHFSGAPLFFGRNERLLHIARIIHIQVSIFYLYCQGYAGLMHENSYQKCFLQVFLDNLVLLLSLSQIAVILYWRN